MTIYKLHHLNTISVPNLTSLLVKLSLYNFNDFQDDQIQNWSHLLKNRIRKYLLNKILHIIFNLILLLLVDSIKKFSKAIIFLMNKFHHLLGLISNMIRMGCLIRFIGHIKIGLTFQIFIIS